MSRIYADYPWRILITTLTSGTVTILDNRGTDRQFLFTLNGPAYHTGQAASDDFEINRPYPNADDPALLTNNRRLLYGLRRELGADPPYVCRFGGIVMTLEDQGADAPTTRYTAWDPWQYLMSRPARVPLSVDPLSQHNPGDLIGEAGFTYKEGELASNIALDMLQISDQEDGETHIDWETDPYLIEDTAPLPGPFVIEQGQSVGEVWQALCDTGTIDIVLDPIYDPINRPGKVVELRIEPLAGQVRFGTVFGWDRGPHSVPDLTRTVDRMANTVLFFSGSAASAIPQVDAASIAANGVYWAQQILNGSMHQIDADTLALTEMRMRRNGQRTITFNPISDRLDYTPLKDYALGDYVPLWASQNLREPFGIDYGAYLADPTSPGGAGYQRVYGIPITVDDNGVERVEGLITSQDSVAG